jgi:hypothetical protein
MTGHSSIAVRREAMTLIELLTSLTLSAMLMAVLLSTLAQHTRTNRRLREKKPFAPWKTLLQQQLQQDYAGCRHVLIQSNRIVMEGYSDQGPVRIEYGIVANQKENWLVREEFDLLQRGGATAQRELVCRGVNQFQALTQLSTDVAPGVLRFRIATDEAEGMTVAVVRHGGAG